MNHQPFESWLLADELLTSEQRQALQVHVRKCADCAALMETNLALRSVRAAAPAPGFADRFRVRLEARRKAQRKRHLLGGLILVIGGLSLLSWFVWPVAARSPSEVIVIWATSLVSILTSLQTFGEIGSVLLRVATGFIPAYAWALAGTLFSGLSLLWVFSIRKFTRTPQGV
ncbi:MAG: hypothetical protein GXP40_01645 [Chloroflexi bacterium]|nr:hypothetical protein [Chloroflexota bacterium]